MRICFLLGGFTGIGGIGRVTSLIANELSKDNRYKIYTLNLFNIKKSNHYTLNKEIHQSFLYNDPINMKKVILKGGIFKLRKFLVDNHIDIIIACGSLYFPLAVFSTKATKTKSICWEHSHSKNNIDHSFQNISRKIGTSYTDYIVTLTKSDKNNYEKKYNISNVKNIYNPIDNNILNNTITYQTESKKIISVGRLTHLKNFETLVEVANEVLKKNPDWTWDIFGDGELRENLEFKVKKYNLERRLNFNGSIKNIYEQYPNYSFLVMTSKYEGFGMVLLEGLANKLPLISFDVPVGPKEVISHNENGYLIEPFNILKMSSAISELIQNKELRNKMSKNSNYLREPFIMKNVIKEWKILFDQLV